VAVLALRGARVLLVSGQRGGCAGAATAACLPKLCGLASRAAAARTACPRLSRKEAARMDQGVKVVKKNTLFKDLSRA
jgi:hypothetical protein